MQAMKCKLQLITVTSRTEITTVWAAEYRAVNTSNLTTETDRHSIGLRTTPDISIS